MKISSSQKNKLLELVSKIQNNGRNCQKGFSCCKSGLNNLCKAARFGSDKYIDCLDDNACECSFSLRFGHGHLCKCPVRNYISRELELPKCKQKPIPESASQN